MDDANFNPYEHRQVEGALSNFDALVFLLNCVLGTGLLAMPLAYKFSGLAGGTALIIFSTIVLTYGIHLLIHCMLETARRTATGYASYTDTMVYSFTQGPKWCHNWSRTSGLLVDVVLGFSHYGISVVYIVFVAYNWKQFLDYYWDTIELKSLIIAVGVCLTPLFLIRDLKVLVP
ncbi:glutamate transporter polyphemus-like, partial [Scaptodrosophila lebanonensis]|uniref:Glutamate transporter polyphemus-like n=1 Tax=Drosophila lebanonensis TaxID=7225 RepID=A0A6J2TAV2_DROLE